MEDCFLLDHDTKQFPRKNAAPLVLFQSSTLPSQSALVNTFKVKSCPFGYHKPYSMVLFRYLKILFTVVTCVYLGYEWNIATNPTTCITYGLVVVTYSKLRIMDLNMV